MKFNIEQQFYNLDSLAEEWQCSKEKLWSYINFGILPVCVHKSSVEQALKDPNSPGESSPISGLDTDRVLRIVRRALPHLHLQESNLIEPKFKFLFIEMKCIPTPSSNTLVYEREKAQELPEFLYINPSLLSKNKASIGNETPKFITFKSDEQEFQLVAEITASMTSELRFSELLFVNTCDLNELGPIGVDLKNKRKFELENAQAKPVTSKNWKEIARDLGEHLHESDTTLTVDQLSQTIAFEMNKRGIKNDRNNLITASSVKRDALTGITTKRKRGK